MKQKKFEILDRNTVLSGLLNIIAVSQTEHQVINRCHAVSLTEHQVGHRLHAVGQTEHQVGNRFHAVSQTEHPLQFKLSALAVRYIKFRALTRLFSVLSWDIWSKLNLYKGQTRTRALVYCNDLIQPN